MNSGVIKKTIRAGLWGLLLVGIWTCPVSAEEASSKAPAPSAGETVHAGAKPKTLIVFDLAAENEVEKGTANLLTELVIDQVNRLKRYKVIGQKDIAKMLSWEQNKQLSGCSDTACLVQMAGAMGADLYVEGSLGVVGDRFIVTLKAIDAVNVAVLERVTKVLPKDGNKVVDAVPQLVSELFSGPALSPQQTAGRIETPKKGARTHDGFFLRMAAGPGFSYTSLVSSPIDRRVSGASLHLNLSVGYSVIENLEISFDMFGPVMPGPSLSYEDVASLAAKSAGWMGFGAGFNYYFMPYNIFLGISLGVGQLTIEGMNVHGATSPSGSTSRSSAGFMAGPMLGKEWWVSDNWGLGLMVQYVFSVAKGDYESWWLGHSVGLMFCATYN